MSYALIIFVYVFFFQPSEESVLMKREEGIDTFTLLHHDLNVCTNNVSTVRPRYNNTTEYSTSDKYFQGTDLFLSKLLPYNGNHT